MDSLCHFNSEVGLFLPVAFLVPVAWPPSASTGWFNNVGPTVLSSLAISSAWMFLLMSFLSHPLHLRSASLLLYYFIIILHGSNLFIFLVTSSPTQIACHHSSSHHITKNLSHSYWYQGVFSLFKLIKFFYFS